MKQITRRKFVKNITSKTVLGAGLLTLPSCSKQSSNQAFPNIQTNKSYKWKMITTWPPHFPIMGEGAEKLAEWIEEMSGGQLQIHVYGGGELVPALEAFDAVSQGVAEMGHGASYYWAGKAAATQFFASVPFGMNAQQMNAWLYSGGGLELWQEVYSAFNLVPFPIGNSGVQMGGWFNKEINSIDDIRGLKMRIPGLGGKVIGQAGGSAILSAGGEIFTNLERGVIDATEWVGPYHDFLMGFHKIAKYYYFPGWHEPGTVLEMFINKNAYNSLPDHLKSIIKTAAYRSNIWTVSEFESKNSDYLQKLIQNPKIELRRFPDDVLKKLKQISNDVINEIISSDSSSKKVYQSFEKFKLKVSTWSVYSERAYYKALTS